MKLKTEDKLIICFVCGMIIGIAITLIYTFYVVDKEIAKFWENGMYFSLEEGDRLIGLEHYCKYESNDCYDKFINWSKSVGGGLYWKP